MDRKTFIKLLLLLRKYVSQPTIRDVCKQIEWSGMYCCCPCCGAAGMDAIDDDGEIIVHNKHNDGCELHDKIQND